MVLAWLKKALAGRFWRVGWACNQRVGSSYFFHVQQTQIFLILLPNENYVPYHTLMFFGKSDKTLVKEWCDTHPLLFSSTHRCYVECLKTQVLSPMFLEGHGRRKIQRKLKEKHRKGFQFDSSTFCQEVILHLWLLTVPGNFKL